ncbi:hypothetical protein M3I54_07330 [Paraburkholderia sp. CNPSo 3274]|nr:hypothetical protein [Paraburkholderia sp. CNPSo 3274]
MELLLLAARTLVSPRTPLWRRALCIDLNDALLELATRHGLTFAEPLLEMLDTDLHGDLRPQNGFCLLPSYSYGYRLEKIARPGPLEPSEVNIHLA